MIIASLLLVIAAAVTLLMGLLNREVIEWVYASIACCILAGILLTIGVLRSRPSRKPVLQSGGDSQPASWAGASQWGGDKGGQSSAGVLTRDADEDADDSTVRVSPPVEEDIPGDDEPTRTSLPEAESGASPWAPADEADTGDVRVLPPPEPEEGEPAAPAAEDEDSDVVVVPKPSARGDGELLPPPAPAAAQEAPPPDAGAPAGSPDEAERFEQVLSPIAGVGPTKRKALLAHFGTYRKLRAATPEKLAEVQGVSRTLADRIHKALHS